MRQSQYLLAAAVALYLFLGLLLASQQPGLQYDEALLVQGGVHLLNQRTELPLPHDPDTFLCRGLRCVPLMTVRYVGAVKEYLGLPLFALWGGSAFPVRLLSLLMSAVSVYGLGRFMAHAVSPASGVVAAFALAMHPAFLDQSVFDNGTVAAPFLALGCLLVAFVRYRESPSSARALLLGCAAGFGVWARANFTWVLLSLLFALNLELLRWIRQRRRDALFCLAGLLAGSFPFWLYQWTSRGGTFAVFGFFPATGSWREILLSRAVMFAESLVSDREHRAVWGAGPIPDWQAWTAAFVLLVALALCWRRYPRLALATTVLYGLHFVSTVQIAEHHFITAIPFAIAVVTATGPRCLIPAYLILTLSWNIAAFRGLGITRGVGQWSHAIVDVHQAIESQHRGRVVNILDWGLQNNLFVLARGRLASREWIGEERDTPHLDAGGLFLTGGDANTFFPSGRTFASRLAGRNSSCEEFREKRGALYARLCDVLPAAAVTASLVGATGLHAPEKEGWRWTKKSFSLDIAAPHFALDIFVPEAVIAKLGPVTLQGEGLAPATFLQSGQYRYTRATKPGRLDFALDKALQPSATDNRELGVILRSVFVWP